MGNKRRIYPAVIPRVYAPAQVPWAEAEGLQVYRAQRERLRKQLEAEKKKAE